MQNFYRYPLLIVIIFLTQILSVDRSPASQESTPLRVISYNIRNFEPLSRTGAGEQRVSIVLSESQIVKRLAMELKLYHPDIISIQEATPKELIAELAREMMMNYVYFPSNWKNENWPYGIAGALMTKFPILESQNCPLVNYDSCPEDIFTRHFGRTVIATESGELVVLSAHLLPGGRDNSSKVHEREIGEIIAVAKRDIKSGSSLILMGDLNHDPNGFEYKMWTEAGFVDAFKSKGSGFALTCPSDVPQERIDYIWAYGSIAQRLSSCQILFEGGFRTNPNDSTSFALSDHVPVIAVFE